MAHDFNHKRRPSQGRTTGFSNRPGKRRHVQTAGLSRRQMPASSGRQMPVSSGGRKISLQRKGGLFWNIGSQIPWERVLPILLSLLSIAAVIAALWIFREAITAFLTQILTWVLTIAVIVAIVKYFLSPPRW